MPAADFTLLWPSLVSGEAKKARASLLHLWWEVDRRRHRDGCWGCQATGSALWLFKEKSLVTRKDHMVLDTVPLPTLTIVLQR